MSVFFKSSATLPAKTYVFDIEVEQDDDGRWAATCPALPGCATWGQSKEEALRNIREAVEGYVEDVIAAGEPVPGARWSDDDLRRLGLIRK